MNKVIRIISAVMVGIMCFACFAACSSTFQPWTDKNVVFTYDEKGNVTITFPDNYNYIKAKTKETKIGQIEGIPIIIDFNDQLTKIIKKDYLDSLYLFKILKRFTIDEAHKLECYDDSQFNGYSIYYEAVIIYDYISKKEMNESFIYRSSTYDETYDAKQIENYPPFSVGDTLVGCLTNSNYRTGCRCSVIVCPMFVLNDEQIDNNTYVYSQNGGTGIWNEERKILPELQPYIMKLDENEKTLASDYTNNSRKFYDKIKLGDYLNFFRNALEKVGYEIK